MGDREGAGSLQPSGAMLRRALGWLDERANEDPRLDRVKAVGEAAVRFDLTPLEEDFLLRTWVRRRE